MAKKKFNGYVKRIGIAFAIAGIIWNAAILHNDVRHLRKALDEIKDQITVIQTYLMMHK